MHSSGLILILAVSNLKVRLRDGILFTFIKPLDALTYFDALYQNPLSIIWKIEIHKNEHIILLLCSIKLKSIQSS